ncbi:vacuolar amino acid permease [Pholiota conissans]|uniref:Vacuolar amino acid permease n=1 Tax=Pholiota conissans TaxID=109636 RepID=A0A9P5Z587_9AGAR|nr:vacuolar amino acid permease [Pholiota conissans]
MSERDPLLSRDSEQQGEEDGIVLGQKEEKRVGPREISRSTRYGILAGIWTATCLSALNQTLVPTMLPSISSDFNKSNQASWLGTSYLLATCTFTPLYGRLCNVLGRKGANQVAMLFAGLGVLMCGLSTSMEMLILARFFAGIGGGGLFTTSSIIVSDMYSIRSRGLAQGVASVFNGLGMGLGGPLGGLITDWLGWRWAFLIQIPFFFVAFILTDWNLNYVTEGTGKSTMEMIRRIDFLGSGSLMMTVGSMLIFLSVRYNASFPMSHPACITSLTCAVVFALVFLYVELFVSPEPVMAPFLLKQKIPVLVGCSNLLVAMCNFSVMYFFPMWFQTVLLTNASTAGLHLLPNSMSMSCGSVFAGWMMHKTGRYKAINLIFGAFPFIGAALIYNMKEDSGPIQSWLSIIPLGFGNAVVLQTVLIALLVHIPEDYMAVGTGFGQLFRGVGQVGGVAISSSIFQSNLEHNLRQRIHGPDADETIMHIRQNARLVSTLPPDLQRIARDSYDLSLHRVFFFAACSTLLAYMVRLPIPDKQLDMKPPAHHPPPAPEPTPAEVVESPFESEDSDSDSDRDEGETPEESRLRPKGNIPIRRRLSTFEDPDAVMSDFQTHHAHPLHGSVGASQNHTHRTPSS